MPEKHVPKHRAPKRELFPRRESPKSRGSSVEEPGAPSANGHRKGLGFSRKPAEETFSGHSSHVIAREAPKPQTQSSPAETAPPPEVAPAPVTTPAATLQANAEPAEVLRPPGPAPSDEPAREGTHTEGGSTLLDDPLPSHWPKSAISTRGDAWDPFLKDAEPTGRFRRGRADPTLEELKISTRRRPRQRNKEREKPQKRRKREKEPAPATTYEQQEHQTLGQWFKEIILLGVIAILTAVLLTNYVVQAFFIPSISMENTLQINDRVLVNKLVYNFRDPRAGDIVVFASPDDDVPEVSSAGPISDAVNKVAQGLGLRSQVQDLIKRVVAVEGQTVEVRIGSLHVDGERVVEPYRKDLLPMEDYQPFVVPAGHVFVMGDNRNQSHDSRSFGPVPESTIVGRAFALIWPVERFSRFPPSEG